MPSGSAGRLAPRQPAAGRRLHSRTAGLGRSSSKGRRSLGREALTGRTCELCHLRVPPSRLATFTFGAAGPGGRCRPGCRVPTGSDGAARVAWDWGRARRRRRQRIRVAPRDSPRTGAGIDLPRRESSLELRVTLTPSHADSAQAVARLILQMWDAVNLPLL